MWLVVAQRVMESSEGEMPIGGGAIGEGLQADKDEVRPGRA
jgi:hypothetical protein